MTARPSPPRRHPLGRLAPAVAPVIVLGIVGGYVDHARFWHGFLAGTVLAAALAIGGLVLVLWQRATEAAWAVTARRPMEWLARGLAFVTITFIVIAAAGRYVWVEWWPELAPDTGPTGAWARWLVPEAFVARSFLYLILLTTIAARSVKATIDAPALRRRAPALLAATAILTTGAATDWLASLHVEGLSLGLVPLAGLVLLASAVVGALAVLALVAHALDRHGGHTDDAFRARIGGALATATLAWIAIAASVATVTALALPDAAARWAPHWLAGRWPIATAIAAVGFVAALAILAVPRARRSPPSQAVAAVGILIGLAIVFAQLALPVHPGAQLSWIELGGLGAGLAPVWLAVLTGASDGAERG